MPNAAADEIVTALDYKDVTRGVPMKNMFCVTALLMAGCATTPSPEGERVRIITAEAARVLACKHVGKFSSLKSANEGGMPAAHIDVRNKVAKANGNAFVIGLQSAAQEGEGDIRGDGYACASF